MKRIALLSVCFVSLIFIGCDKKNSNAEMGGEAEQPFVMKAPDAGNLPFETLSANIIDGQYFVSALTEKKEGITVLMMGFSFAESAKTGEVLTIGNCFLGPYNVNASYATHPSGGRVFLKEKKDNNLVLRFEEIRFVIDQGEYQLNGDLSFATEKVY